MKYIKKLYEFKVNPTLKTLTKQYNLLYHGLKSKYATLALENNKLNGYSLQRIWKNWKRYQDDQPEYNDSDYLRGISTTRDIEYANRFGGGIIFIFDKDKLKSKFKILPYNWGYNIGNGYRSNIKREKEEFVITGFDKNYLINSITGEKYDDEDTVFNKYIDMIESPKGAIDPLDKYLIGFFISEIFIDTIDIKTLNKLKSNKLYLGIYKL
jgi:hypothetical protein